MDITLEQFLSKKFFSAIQFSMAYILNDTRDSDIFLNVGANKQITSYRGEVEAYTDVYCNKDDYLNRIQVTKTYTSNEVFSNKLTETLGYQVSVVTKSVSFRNPIEEPKGVCINFVAWSVSDPNKSVDAN